MTTVVINLSLVVVPKCSYSICQWADIERERNAKESLVNE